MQMTTPTWKTSNLHPNQTEKEKIPPTSTISVPNNDNQIETFDKNDDEKENKITLGQNQNTVTQSY